MSATATAVSAAYAPRESTRRRADERTTEGPRKRRKLPARIRSQWALTRRDGPTGSPWKRKTQNERNATSDDIPTRARVSWFRGSTASIGRAAAIVKTGAATRSQRLRPVER